MPFALDSDPTTSEISDAINYLLSNFNVGSTFNPITGQIVAPGGIVVGYLYEYIAIKYADDQFGTGFSNSPTNKGWYGVNNSESASESTNPADYVWYQATGGFGTTKYLWYLCTGGRQIQFAVSSTAPDTVWLVDPGSSIDLDVVTSGTTPIIAESFVGYFAPSTLQVPRAGNPLAPVFTGVIASMYATNAGIVVPFTDAQTDSSVAFVNNSWRIGNSSTTGYGDISYTNITVGNPTDAGDYAQWPAPTAMSASPAYISVPLRYKNSTGVVSQAGVATLQYVFVDPGPAGQDSPYIDISGFTGFTVNSGGAFTPATATLTAVTTSVTSPTYSWSITNATPTSSTNSSVVITPNSGATSVSVTLTVNGTNLLSPLSKTISMPVTFNGTPGTAGANGLQSAFPSIYIWTGSSAVPTRPTTTSTYTWADGSYSAPTGWSTQAPTNTTPGNYLWQITVPLTVSATTTTSTLDWTNTAYPIRCIAYNGTNGAAGSSASVLTLASTAQTFTYDQSGAASPSSQTITFTANLQNLSGTATFTATNYNSSGTAISNPSLGGSGNTRTLAVADFGVAAYCVVQATLSGYTDVVTVVRLQDGLNTTTGLLTNESVTVQTDSSGNGGNYTNAGGTFKMYNGTTDVTTSSAFSLVSATSGLSITINASTGVYTVTNLTAAQGSATLRAVYGTVTIDKVYSISKSYAGSNGLNGTRTAILDMYQWSSTTPTAFPSGTSTYTWATGQFTAPGAPNGWSLTPPSAVLGQTLYIARTVYSDTNTSATTSVTWTATSANPAGASGVNGARTAFLEVYQWAASTPTGFPSGSSTYTWATGVFTAPTTPNGWSLTPGASTPGYKLYACSVSYVDTDTTATSTVNWTTSSAYVVGSAGTNGTNGTNGTDGTNGSATFLVTRTANDSSPPTNAEVTAVIGRTPVAGDIVTVSYNNANNAVVYRYTTSWITQATYITGSLIVDGTITAPKLSVTQLSAISANMGTITAGDLQIGSSPVISGTTMTGTGAHIYSSGNFAFGNSTTNMVFNGSNVFLNGFVNATTSSFSFPTTISSETTFISSFTLSKASYCLIGTYGSLRISRSTIFACADVNYFLYIRDYTTNALIDAISINMTIPAVYLNSSYWISFPVSLTGLSNLSAGTYKVNGKATVALYDSTGTNVTSGYNTQAWIGTSFVYQSNI